MSIVLASQSSDVVGSSVERATLVIPIGATEQHGPHLPLRVDALIAERVAHSAAARATTEQRPVWVAPTLAYGASDHHLPRPGTLSLRGRTYLAVLTDLVESAVVGGFQRIVLLNGHGGNEDLARQAAREVTVERPVVVGAAGYWTLGWRALSRIAVEEGLGGMPGHAGAFETSLLLHLEPEVVSLERAQDTPPEATGPDHPASLPWVETHGWVESLHGYSPGVRRASAVIGQRLFTTIIEATATWLAEFARREAPSPAPSGRTRNGRSL